MKKLSSSVLRLYKVASKKGNNLIAFEERIPTTFKVVAFIALFVFGGLLATVYLKDKNLAILQPHGTLGIEERKIIYSALLLSLVVIIPVFTMSLFIYTKYREKNTTSKYQPNWDHSTVIEGVWWLIPIILISLLSFITWKSSHDLDPFKPLVSDKKPLTVEVIALDWKWLFIYPEQGVASVNAVHIPVDTPVDFKITSDAPMNSFWVPELGGQIYAMSGMTTHLQSMATRTGMFDGASSNISGKGYAGMNFKVFSSTQQDFDSWVNTARVDGADFGAQEYKQLALPSENNEVKVFSLTDDSLFDKVLIKYMNATSTDQSTELVDQSERSF